MGRLSLSVLLLACAAGCEGSRVAAPSPPSPDVPPGPGTLDAVGRCHDRRTYTSPAVAMVCVSDGRAGKFACRMYRVEPTDEAQTLGAAKTS